MPAPPWPICAALLVSTLCIHPPPRPRSRDRRRPDTNVLRPIAESNDLAHVDRSKGKFRAFLLAACTHFLANERDRHAASSAGGDRKLVSIDRDDAERSYGREPVDRLTPEALFARRWAMTLLDQTMDDLRQEFRPPARRSSSRSSRQH